MMIRDCRMRILAACVFLASPVLLIVAVYSFLQVGDFRTEIARYVDLTTGQSGTLPFSAARTTPQPSGQPAFAGEIDIAAAPGNPQEYVLIPSYTGRLVLTHGTQTVFDSALLTGTQSVSSMQSHMIPLPKDVQGNIPLRFELYRSNLLFVGMSRLYVGERIPLERANARLDLYTQFIKVAYWGAELFAIIILLTLFAFRAIGRRELSVLVIFVYLILVQTPAVLGDYLGLSGTQPFIHCGIYLVIWALITFYQDIVGHRRNQVTDLLLASGALLSCLALLICVADPAAARLLHLLVTFPLLTVVLVGVSVTSMMQFLTRGHLNAAIYATGALTIGMSLLHDMVSRAGLFDTQVAMGGTSALIFFICTVFLLTARVLISQRAMAAQNDVMKIQLDERTRQLADEYRTQAALREQNAIATEKQRMTRDLHDGVLTCLSMIQTLSEHDRR